MKQKNRIIALATIATMSLTLSLDCFARGAKPSIQDSKNSNLATLSAVQNNKAYFYKESNKLPSGGVVEPPVRGQKGTFKGFMNRIKEGDKKLTAARVTNVKAKIKAKKSLEPTAYTWDAEDNNKIESLRTNFLTEQNKQ